jgi:dihydroorotate dehydrogenase (NAD+) catalytic subunit
LAVTTPSSLAIDLAGIPLRTPVMLAAGTAGTLTELADVLALSRIGGLVTKSITVEPREGNKTWRIVPTEHGMLNAIGLANIGVEAFARDYAPKVASVPTSVIGSVSEFSIEGYVRVAAMFDQTPGIQGIELNVSCPNVNHGCEFGSDPVLLAELVREVRRVTTRTRLLVKLSPVVMGNPGIVAISKVAIEPAGSSPSGPNARPGADCLCIANTVPAMAIDVETRSPRLSRGGGGLSGPGIHPIAVRLVHDAYQGICKSTQTPIVGIGGVLRWQDAAEFIIAGATAVEVGTGLFIDPKCPLTIAKGLEAWVRRQGAASIRDLIGSIRPPEDPTVRNA